MARSKGIFSPPPGPRAAEVFTDREDARTVLRTFFEELLARPFIESKPIKVFYGVGGAGKTALREKSIGDFCTQMSDQGGYPLAFAQIDLDSDTFTPDYPIFDLFSRHLRTALKQVGCSLPLFNLYCLAWTARMAESANFGREEVENFLGIHEKTVEVAGSLWTPFAELASSIKGVSLILKAAIAFRDSRRAKRYAERFPDIELAELTSADFEKNAHEVLASDLMAFLDIQGERNAHPYALYIAVDGFERIQSTVNARNSQWALQALCDRIATHEPRYRCGFIFFGRNRLLWRSLYDQRNDLPEETWDVLIEHHLVGGLSQNDASIFLDEVQAWYERHKADPICAKIYGILTEYRDVVFDAAVENPTDQSEPVFHPFALDLAIKQIGIHCNHFDVRRHLGRGHKDLQERFLRYMEPDQRSALQSLALALEFDETLFQILVSRHVIKGIQVQDFHDLIGPDNSHVLPIGQSYRFHSKMQEALFANLQDQQNGMKKAQMVIEILVAHYSEQLAQAVQDRARNAMLGAFTRASNILLTHAQSGMLDTAVFQSIFFALEDSLPEGVLASARKIVWMRASAILAEKFSGDNEYALRARASVAYWTGEAGEASTALALSQALLSDQQRVLGPDHPDTLRTRNNIAAWTGEAGEASAALALLQALLPDQQRVLGPDHPDTLRTHANIAAWTGEIGEASAALALSQALLPDRQRVLGPDHPDTLTTRNNIAAWTGKAGEASAALALFQALLPDQQRVLGPDHPDTLRTRANIAHWTGRACEASAALALFQALLPDRQRVLGPDHPNTLRTRNNIAVWTGKTGEASVALALFQALLPDQQRVLGPDHPDTCSTKDWIVHLERQ